MQKVSLKHIYVLPRKSIRQEKPSQRCAFMQTNLGSVKPSIPKIQLRQKKKQTRRVCLPERPQHIEEMIPSEIQMMLLYMRILLTIMHSCACVELV